MIFILNVDLMAGVLAVILQHRETNRIIKVLLIKDDGGEGSAYEYQTWMGYKIVK